MASIRRGYSDDFTLKNNSVGIGTSTGQEALDVVDGAVKGQDLKVTGISSFTAYEGFLRADHQIAENTTLSFDQGPSASLSGEIIVGTGVTVTIASVGLGTTMVGNGSGTIENTIDTTDVTRAGGSEIECLKVYNTFTPPSGGTNERPEAPKPGELYYNYDFKTIEFFDGYGWRQVDNTTRSGRGLYGGGRVEPGTPKVTTVGYINIGSLGNSEYFGELTNARQNPAACSSSTRGLWGGGNPGFEIDYVTIASEGSAIDFGDLTVNRYIFRALSSSTRGIWAGGWTGSSSDTIDYVEFSTTGNALDFGDMTVALNGPSCTSSSTRGLIAGGRTPSVYYSHIDAITIASKGDAVDTGGDLVSLAAEHAGVSNGNTALFMGRLDPVLSSTCEFVKISSNGNGVFFGDLSEDNSNGAAVSTNTRGVYIAGRTPLTPSIVNTMEYVTFSSLGNAIDFGDISAQTKEFDACSDSHGGLGGF